MENPYCSCKLLTRAWPPWLKMSSNTVPAAAPDIGGTLCVSGVVGAGTKIEVSAAAHEARMDCPSSCWP